MTDLYGDNYYKAIKKYFPEGKFVNPKKNLPKIPGKTILKRAGLAGIVYQLAEYITDKLEPETPENARFFPGEAGSVEARENYRRQAIENNLTKMEYSDDGTIKMSMGANVNLTDHIPYKVEVKDASNIPDAPGAAKKYKYVDPYDDIYGAIADDKYELTEIGYVKKQGFSVTNSIVKNVKEDYQTLKSYTPPEIRKILNSGKDVVVGTAKLTAKGLGF